jgi:hypothetical protein
MEGIVVVLAVMALFMFLMLLLIGSFGIADGYSSRELCSACRYPVEGLSASICPECGGNLEGKGTRPAGSPTWEWRPSRLLAVVCMMTLSLPILLPIMSSIANDGPFTHKRSMHATLTPKSAQYAQVQLTISGTGTFRTEPDNRASSNRHVTRPRTKALIDGTWSSARFQLIDEQMRATFTDGDQKVTTTDSFSGADIERWLAANNIVIEGDGREELLGEIASTIAWVASGGTVAPPSTNTIIVTPTLTHLWYPAIGAKMGFFIGLAVLFLYIAIRVSQTPPGPLRLGLRSKVIQLRLKSG